jgi:hypothetical protein
MGAFPTLGSRQLLDRITPASVGDLAALIPSFERSLRATNKSPKTVQVYGEAAGHSWPSYRKMACRLRWPRSAGSRSSPSSSTEHPQRESRRSATGRRRCRHDPRQVASDLRQLGTDVRTIGKLGTIRELVECQPPFHKIGSQGPNGELTIVVRDTMAGVHHGPNDTGRELRMEPLAESG